MGTIALKPDLFQTKISQSVTDLEFNVLSAANDEGDLELKGVLRIGFLESNLASGVEILSSFLSEPNFRDYENISTLIRMVSSEVTQNMVSNSEEMVQQRAKIDNLKHTDTWNDLTNVNFNPNISFLT
jgi:Zn-dependent M16 (insulinase) family peptidase